MTSQKQKINQISTLITQGIESWVKAGEILVEILDSQETRIQEISIEIGIPVGILGKFEMLGRKQIVPNLLIADYPASRYMQRLPYSEQERLEGESIELLASDGKDKILISPKNLTPSQCKQAFSSRAVRDLGEQRAWIESCKMKSKIDVVESGMSYHIEKGQVIFDRGCVMKASQLLSILAQLTQSK